MSSKDEGGTGKGAVCDVCGRAVAAGRASTAAASTRPPAGAEASTAASQASSGADGEVKSEGGPLPQLLRCGRCKARVYCGKKCQVVDWKAGHKAACRPQARGAPPAPAPSAVAPRGAPGSAEGGAGGPAGRSLKLQMEETRRRYLRQASSGDMRGAADTLAALRDLARRSGDAEAEAKSAGELGACLESLGRLDEASECIRFFLDWAETNGHRSAAAKAHGNLGLVLAKMGDVERAITHHRRDVALQRELWDRASLSRALCNLGNALLRDRQVEAAIECHKEDARITHDLGDSAGEMMALSNLGAARLELGDFRAAEADYRRSLSLAKSVRDLGGRVRAEAGVGDALLQLGDAEGALKCQQRYLSAAEEARSVVGQAKAHAKLGHVHAARGDWRAAEAAHKRSQALYTSIRSGPGVTQGCLCRARALRVLGDMEGCQKLCRELLRIASDSGGLAPSLRVSLRASTMAEQVLSEVMGVEDSDALRSLAADSLKTLESLLLDLSGAMKEAPSAFPALLQSQVEVLRAAVRVAAAARLPDAAAISDAVQLLQLCGRLRLPLQRDTLVSLRTWSTLEPALRAAFDATTAADSDAASKTAGIAVLFSDFEPTVGGESTDCIGWVMCMPPGEARVGDPCSFVVDLGSGASAAATVGSALRGLQHDMFHDDSASACLTAAFDTWVAPVVAKLPAACELDIVIAANECLAGIPWAALLAHGAPEVWARVRSLRVVIALQYVRSVVSGTASGGAGGGGGGVASSDAPLHTAVLCRADDRQGGLETLSSAETDAVARVAPEAVHLTASTPQELKVALAADLSVLHIVANVAYQPATLILSDGDGGRLTCRTLCNEAGAWQWPRAVVISQPAPLPKLRGNGESTVHGLDLCFSIGFGGAAAVVTCLWTVHDGARVALALRLHYELSREAKSTGRIGATSLVRAQRWMQTSSCAVIVSFLRERSCDPAAAAVEELRALRDCSPGEHLFQHPRYWAGWVCVSL